MKVKIRANVFETNSSSQHVLCIINKDDEFTPEEIKDGMWIRHDGILRLYEDDLTFDRYPFDILSSFYDKLKYLIASFVGNNQDDKPFATACLDAIRDVCRDVIPDFENFEFDTSYRSNRLFYGYAQNYGYLVAYLTTNNISFKDFLTKKRYIIIIDGDEYNKWDKIKKCKIIDTSCISKEVVFCEV